MLDTSLKIIIKTQNNQFVFDVCNIFLFCVFRTVLCVYVCMGHVVPLNMTTAALRATFGLRMSLQFIVLLTTGLCHWVYTCTLLEYILWNVSLNVYLYIVMIYTTGLCHWMCICTLLGYIRLDCVIECIIVQC